MSESDYKKYECVICGFIYDEAEGLPDDGFPPGTRWEKTAIRKPSLRKKKTPVGTASTSAV